MKASVALIFSWMVFSVVGTLFTIVIGPFDIYAVASLLFLIPSGLLGFFLLEKKSFSASGECSFKCNFASYHPDNDGTRTNSPLLAWETNLATLLLAPMALQDLGVSRIKAMSFIRSEIFFSQPQKNR